MSKRAVGRRASRLDRCISCSTSMSVHLGPVIPIVRRRRRPRSTWIMSGFTSSRDPACRSGGFPDCPGRWTCGGMIVRTWAEGRPPSAQVRRLFHRRSVGLGQPGFHLGGPLPPSDRAGCRLLDHLGCAASRSRGSRRGVGCRADLGRDCRRIRDQGLARDRRVCAAGGRQLVNPDIIHIIGGRRRRRTIPAARPPGPGRGLPGAAQAIPGGEGSNGPVGPPPHPRALRAREHRPGRDEDLYETLHAGSQTSSGPPRLAAAQSGEGKGSGPYPSTEP